MLTYKPHEHGFSAYIQGRTAGEDPWANDDKACPYVRGTIEEIAWITGFHETRKQPSNNPKE